MAVTFWMEDIYIYIFYISRFTFMGLRDATLGRYTTTHKRRIARGNECGPQAHLCTYTQSDSKSKKKSTPENSEKAQSSNAAQPPFKFRL